MLESKAIRSYMQRDWAALAHHKQAYWLEQKRAYGPIWGMRMADELRRGVMTKRPTWPDAAQRAADLQHHVYLSRLFAQVHAARCP